MKKLIFVVLILVTSTGCISSSGGGYYLVSAPMGSKPVWPQVIDVLIQNDCSPYLTAVAHGSHKDSVITVLTKGQSQTIRLPRAMFSGQGGAELSLMVKGYRALPLDPINFIGSASGSWYVDTWTSRDPVWQVCIRP